MTTPLSTADLLAGLAAKKRYKYVLFWGDTPPSTRPNGAASTFSVSP